MGRTVTRLKDANQTDWMSTDPELRRAIKSNHDADRRSKGMTTDREYPVPMVKVSHD